MGGLRPVVQIFDVYSLKDVRAKIFQSTRFFKFLLQADNELPVPEMQKNLGVTVFVSEIKRVVNYTDFENLYIIEHGLQGFIVKNIEGESKDANDLNHILCRWICCVNNSKCYRRFHKI